MVNLSTATMDELAVIAEIAEHESESDPESWSDVLASAQAAIDTGVIDEQMASELESSLDKDIHWDSLRDTYSVEGRDILRDLARQGHLEKYEPDAVRNYRPRTITVDGVKYEC